MNPNAGIFSLLLEVLVVSRGSRQEPSKSRLD
jgi:hypothetical protein